EISEHQPDLRVLQHVLQIIGKTQHTLVAGGDPVTKRKPALFCRAENIRTQGTALADEGRRSRLRKSSVETNAESGRHFLWKVNESGTIGAADGNPVCRCNTLQFVLQAKSFAAYFGESRADDGRRLDTFGSAFLQGLGNSGSGQSNDRQIHLTRDIRQLCETRHPRNVGIL